MNPFDVGFTMLQDKILTDDRRGFFLKNDTEINTIQKCFINITGKDMIMIKSTLDYLLL